MLILTIAVPKDPDRAAVARLNDGMTVLARGHAAATVPRDLAARKGNPTANVLRPWGDACKGLYRLKGTATVPEGCRAEYGRVLIGLEPVGGEARDAEALGRLGTALYAGQPGADGGLRRTQGGVRITPDLMDIILQRVGAGEDLVLDIGTWSPRGWWQFWRKKVDLPPLSIEPPNFVEAPLDEATLLAEALRHAINRSRPPQWMDDDDHDRRTTSSSSGGGDSFQGQGGTFGGGGATGSWKDAGGSTQPAAAKGAGSMPPGVDAAGRIISGAAGLAAAGAVAADLMREGDRDADGSGAAAEGSPASAGDQGGGGTAY